MVYKRGMGGCLVGRCVLRREAKERVVGVRSVEKVRMYIVGIGSDGGAGGAGYLWRARELV